VENGEVIAILDITRCLYDAIIRMEKAAEQGSAIAAAVEGVERHRGSSASGWLTIIFTSTSMQCLYCSCHRRVQKFYVLLI